MIVNSYIFLDKDRSKVSNVWTNGSVLFQNLESKFHLRQQFCPWNVHLQSHNDVAVPLEWRKPKSTKGCGVVTAADDEFLWNPLASCFVFFCQLVWDPPGSDLSLTQNLGQNPEKKTLICLLHPQFPDFCVSLLPTCCWQQPPMCHPVPSTDCYFCIISNDWHSRKQDTHHETVLWSTVLSPQTSRCAMLHHSVASNHLSYGGLWHLSLILPITTYPSI